MFQYTLRSEWKHGLVDGNAAQWMEKSAVDGNAAQWMETRRSGWKRGLVDGNAAQRQL